MLELWKKYQWKIVLGVLALGLLLVVRTCLRTDGAGGTITSLHAEAVTGELLVTVRASGEILSRDANRIIPRIKRSVVVSHLVPEGSRVTQGEIIAQFSADDLDQRISDAEATLADRELQVASARTDLEIQELENSNSLKLAEQAVADAILELQKFQEGDVIRDIRAADLRIATTISTLDRSIRKHREAGELLTEGFITEDQVEEERIAMETAIVDAETARQDLFILQEYELPLRRNRVESGKEKARTELEKTIKKNEVQAQNKRQALDAAIRTRDRAELDLENLRREREDFDIRAPIDGVVNYGDPANPWRRNDMQSGMNLNPGEVLVTIPNMAAMQANINVPEADVDKVRVGQTAAIYVEAMGRRTFAGEVVRVAEVANPGGWMSSDVKEFRVEVAITDGEGLRPGFSTDAEITIDRIPDALLLPVQAVFRDTDGSWVVYTGISNRPVKVPVTIGRTSITHVQILSGLQPGEKVLLNPSGEAR